MNWLTAATNIQDAINVAVPVSDTVLVTNGIYQYGGDSFNGSNRVDVASVTVQSVNGPDVTIIKGHQVPDNEWHGRGALCFYSGIGEALWLYTNRRSHGEFRKQLHAHGGGILAETGCVISNCIITGNTSFGDGGGANLGAGTRMINCILAGNRALANSPEAGRWRRLQQRIGVFLSHLGPLCAQQQRGRDRRRGKRRRFLQLRFHWQFRGQRWRKWRSCFIIVLGNWREFWRRRDLQSLLNCTVVGNTATNNGGGVIDGTGSPVANSIVCYNTCLNNPAAANGPSGTTSHSCTTPLPYLIVGCFTNEPLLVNWAGGDFHLQSTRRALTRAITSFVTNGKPLFAALTNDFEGNPRIIGTRRRMWAPMNIPRRLQIYPTPGLVLYGFPTSTVRRITPIPTVMA